MDVVNNSVLFEKIKGELGTDKIDFIISRMAGPLNSIDKNPAILDRLIRDWYEMLNENGLLLVQFYHLPEKGISNQGKQTIDIIRRWVKAVTEEFPDMEIRVGERAVRINKKAESPETLPNAVQLNLK